MVSPCESQTRGCMSISLPQSKKAYWEHHRFNCHDVSCLSLLVIDNM
jgi:hypothetical protein